MAFISHYAKHGDLQLIGTTIYGIGLAIGISNTIWKVTIENIQYTTSMLYVLFSISNGVSDKNKLYMLLFE